MNKFKVAALAVAFGGVTSASATTFLYSYTSNDGMEAASGTLMATANGDGAFTADSGSPAAV
jgi:hypothetical protein